MQYEQNEQYYNIYNQSTENSTPTCFDNLLVIFRKYISITCVYMICPYNWCLFPDVEKKRVEKF